MEPGSHSAFIFASYIAAVLVVGALIAWVSIDHRRQRHIIAELEARGLTRRSARPQESKP
jgi:heme exporter protein D